MYELIHQLYILKQLNICISILNYTQWHYVLHLEGIISSTWCSNNELVRKAIESSKNWERKIQLSKRFAASNFTKISFSDIHEPTDIVKQLSPLMGTELPRSNKNPDYNISPQFHLVNLQKEYLQKKIQKSTRKLQCGNGLILSYFILLHFTRYIHKVSSVSISIRGSATIAVMRMRSCLSQGVENDAILRFLLVTYAL